MKTNNKKEEVKKYDMETIPIVEMPKIDIEKYIGRKAKIVLAEVIGTEYGRAIHFETEVLATEGTEQNPIQIKASKLLGLRQDDKGNWGMGNGGKTFEFFQKWNLKTHKDMIGKIVVCQATEQKNGVQFLTFA